MQKTLILTLLFAVMSVVWAAQTPLDAREKLDRMKTEWAHAILRDAHDAVKNYYYDPHYHGIDLEAQYRLYDSKIDTAPSFNECLRFVAAFLEGLKDSHTFLVPPDRPYRFDYGFRMQLLGTAHSLLALVPARMRSQNCIRATKLLPTKPTL